MIVDYAEVTQCGVGEIVARADLAAAARQLNARPRQTLGWMKPSEMFSRAVASTG